MKHDRTFSDGYKKKDAINGLTIKADVMAWITRRSKFSDRVVIEETDSIIGIHHDDL